MKHAITADLQFDPQPRFSSINSDGITTRLADALECFRWVVDQSVERGCENLFVIGDLFDSRTSIDVSVIDRVCRAFHDASEHLTIYVIVGNHDSYLRTPKLNSLQMLRGAAEVIEEPTIVRDFYCVPWHDDSEEVRRMVQAKTGAGANYLLTHAMVKGAVPNVADKGLPVEWFERKKPWRGVFLGDVHDPVVIREKPLIRYAGAPLQIHFGDAGGDRGFLIVDDTGGSVEFVENDVSPRFHILRNWEAKMPEISDIDFVRVRADDIEVGEELTEAARKCTSWVESPAIPDHIVKARLKVTSSASDKDVVEAYTRHMGVRTDALVAEGVELLEAAKGSA